MRRATGEGTHNYGYDADGKRVWKQTNPTGGSSATEIYIYAGPNPVAVYTSGTAASSPDQERVTAQSIDSWVMIDDGTDKLNVLRNQQWSVAALTDSTDGSVDELYAYDVFGERTILNGSGTAITASAYDNNLGYTSREHDEETELIVFRSRMFDVKAASFLSKDTSFIDGASLYRGYLLLDSVDPFGTFKSSGMMFEWALADWNHQPNAEKGIGMRTFLKLYMCPNMVLGDGEWSEISTTIAWDYTLRHPIDNRPRANSELEERIRRVKDGINPTMGDDTWGDARGSIGGSGVREYKDCEGCWRLRVKYHGKVRVRVLAKDHELFKQGFVSAYAPNAGPLTFEKLVSHEWDHAKTYSIGLHNKMLELKPFMEKKYDDQIAANKASHCLTNKIKAANREAIQHLKIFDDQESAYLGGYEKFPFESKVDFGECQ